MMFDFNHDGELSFGEAMSAAGVIGAYADEMMRESEKAEKSKRKSSGSFRYDDDSDDNDWDDEEDFDSDNEDWNGIGKVDASRIDKVMDAVESAQYDWDDIEQLVEDALDNGVKFDEYDVEAICARIFDDDLKFRLRASV